MISQIVTYIHLIDLTILVLDLDKDILKKVVEMLLNGSL
jgi:hypothetical protein